MKTKNKMNFFILGFIMFLISCNSIPENVTAVNTFDKSRYLGKWYELARFDFRFEKDLNNTTADYSLNSDGSIKVINRGFDTVNNVWKESIGKAKFVGKETVAMLKVTFFWPFYGGYNVIAIDPEYKYALVCGDNLDYLWILSREKKIPKDIESKFLNLAHGLGFDLKKLLWIKHDR